MRCPDFGAFVFLSGQSSDVGCPGGTEVPKGGSYWLRVASSSSQLEVELPKPSVREVLVLMVPTQS